MFHVPEAYRITQGAMASNPSYGNNGAFYFPTGPSRRDMSVIASDGNGWEHVSAKAGYRGKKTYIPNWEEMCYLKSLFWDEEDVVLQYHPKKSEYVNMHPHVLHLWRPVGIEIPTPPPELVGIRTDTPVNAEAFRRAIPSFAWDVGLAR